jgi:DNA-binding transcriptional LysR family regulator
MLRAVLLDVNGTLTDPSAIGAVWARADLGECVLQHAMARGVPQPRRAGRHPHRPRHSDFALAKRVVDRRGHPGSGALDRGQRDRRHWRKTESGAGSDERLVEAAGLESGLVAIASETLRTISDLLAGFLRAHHSVRFRLYQSTAERMLTQLQEGNVDLCFASQPLTGSLLESVVLAREDVLLALPMTHRLAGRKRVRIRELEGEPLVTTREGYWLRALTAQIFSTAGVEPNIACEGDEPAAIRGLISDGLGIGLLPAIARETTSTPTVAWTRIDAANCQRTLSLVWRRDAYVSLAAKQFRQAVIDHFSPPRGHSERLPRSPCNFGDGGPVVIVTQ